ncbi:hypothetical protein GYH30_007069 [Glycine max]|nr:hypothetical protein GYH30_007069 [Glycine max]
MNWVPIDLSIHTLLFLIFLTSNSIPTTKTNQIILAPSSVTHLSLHKSKEHSRRSRRA